MELVMYNTEWKAKFISENETSLSLAAAYERLFALAAPFEEAWGADLCTRSTEELEPALEQMFGLRIKSKQKMLVMLRKYVRWCVASRYPGATDGISHSALLGLGAMRTQTVKSPADLQKFLNETCDPESENTLDCIYRCMYWMAFGGMAEEDAMDVRCGDVDFENMEIRRGDRSCILYREALPAFRNAARLSAFVFKHPKYEITRPRVEGDRLLRGVRGTATTLAMRTELSRRNKKALEDGHTNKQLSYSRVWLSGLFYAALQQEELGEKEDFSRLAASYHGGNDYKLDKSRRTQAGVRRDIAEEYQTNFERWKAAHYSL